MACGSGCCGPPKSPPVDRPAREDADVCCGENEPMSSSIDNCQDSCCGSIVGEKSQESDCRSFGTAKTPSCCEGRPSPCCDSTCIDRIALCECKSECDRVSALTDDIQERTGTPCGHHLRRAQKQFTSKLEAPGCICRALLALGQESCCPPARQSSPHNNRSKFRTSVASCASVDSCCEPETTKACSVAETACCADARCNTEKTNVIDVIRKSKSRLPYDCDIEIGSRGKEHVVLSVSGMTCTGYETKLSRTLAALPSITQLKSSLILSRVEFDLDTGVQSMVEVMKHLERTTEFKYERVAMRGSSSLDLICADPTILAKSDWPAGVLEVKVIDKRTVRVDFDAKVIGARDLVETGWPTPVELAPSSPDATLDAGARHVRHLGYMTLLSILLTIPVLVLAWAPLPNKEQNEILFGAISLAFATIIQVVVAGPFYPTALKSLVFSKVVEMDLLIVLSTSVAYIFSVVAFAYLVNHQPLSTGEFFETSTLLVTLIMVGRFIAALARQKATESISIRSLQTSSATLVHSSEHITEEEIDARILQYGDIFMVSPDSRVPTDGTVISGASEVDESMLTGEPLPVEKFKGSPIIAGSINGSGVLTVRLTRVPGDNTISTIAGMVDDAKLSKPKVQEIADQVATYFVPVIVLITIVVFCIWIGVGIAVQRKSASEATVQAITYAITVLIVSCPCAVGLAAPMVIVVATGVAAERGVIFKSANAVEIAWKTAHVVFDKTGTLTEGKLSVARKEYLESSPSTKALLLGLIRSSNHPVSVAVATHLKTEGVSATTISNPKSVIGKGVEGSFAGRKLQAGNSRWLSLSENAFVQSILSQGYTVFCFTVDGKLVAAFGLEDSLRTDTASTVKRLQESNIAVHVLSGDDDGAVRAITTQLGIPTANVRSRCTPGDKQDYVNKLLNTPDPRSSAKKHTKPVVMFCGDGTNDAVALAQATIGVHMNEGTDVAQSAADIVLMRPSLAGVLVAITVSRKSISRIAFNFGWSFVYNVLAILLAAGAFVHARIPPEFAGLGELVSVLPVVAAGILLKWARI